MSNIERVVCIGRSVGRSVGRCAVPKTCRVVLYDRPPAGGFNRATASCCAPMSVMQQECRLR